MIAPALDDAVAVLRFWFGAPDAPDHGRPRAQWFVKNDDFDRQIADRFGDLIRAAIEGRCDHWLSAPETALACVLVLDQFTRNTGRNTPAMFAGDARALAAARLMVANGWDRLLLPIQRSFVYLPFEHSESPADQQESLRLFALLRDDPDAGSTWEWADKHAQVIGRFGRFPHRNQILGRTSTPEELAFLEQPGSRF